MGINLTTLPNNLEFKSDPGANKFGIDNCTGQCGLPVDAGKQWAPHSCNTS